MSEFINVTKDGEVIGVHPDALADHLRLGWVVVPAESEAPAPAAAAAPAPRTEEKKKPK
jgi:hypothetical protein